MKICICSSIDFTPQIKEAADELEKLGHEAEIPLTAQKILAGELTLEEYKKEKENNGDVSYRRKIKDDVIKRYYKLIGEADAVLVLNYDKKGIKNYIGGNTFLEMGFAHVLGKRAYLLNTIPKMLYMDEIKAMNPIIINGDLKMIK